MRKFLGAISALVLGVAIAIIPSSTAQAALTKPDSCGNLMVCAYVNSQFETNQGYELIPVESVPPGVCDRPSFPNAWSSLWNGAGRSIRLYKNATCSGTDTLTYTNGTGVTFLSVLHPTFENNIESYKFI